MATTIKSFLLRRVFQKSSALRTGDDTSSHAVTASKPIAWPQAGTRKQSVTYQAVTMSTRRDMRAQQRSVAYQACDNGRTLAEAEQASEREGAAMGSAPETEVELHLQRIWADVLDISLDLIGRYDSFLSLGGDSISIIHFINAALQEDLFVTIKDVFKDPRLLSVAGRCEVMVDGVSSARLASPFELLDPGLIAAVESAAHQQCHLTSAQAIQDTYPCTPSQESLMASSNPGSSHTAKWVYRLDGAVEITRFKDAWERTVAYCPNLRTRIISVGGRMTQAVVTNDIHWDTGGDIDLIKPEMGPGTRLNRYSLVEDVEGGSYFVWVAHHAIIDTWTRHLIMRVLGDIYGCYSTLRAAPYSRFVQYSRSIDMNAAGEYWSKQLSSVQLMSFPPAGNGARQCNRMTIKFPSSTSRLTTRATTLRAAWAMVLAEHDSTDTICFGSLVPGRQAPILDLSVILGPTAAVVPVCISLRRDQDIASFLQQIQDQAVEMIQYEQFGLQNIAKLGFEEACNFTSLLAIQQRRPVGSDAEGMLHLDESTTPGAIPGHLSCPLIIEASLSESYAELFYHYDDTAISEAHLTTIFSHLEHVIGQLTTLEASTLLKTISVSSPLNLEQARSWNTETRKIDACIHEVIAQMAAAQLEKQALYSSEDSLTFAELETRASRLAGCLLRKVILGRRCYARDSQGRWCVCAA